MINKNISFLISLFILLFILNSLVVYSWSWSGTQSFDCDGCCVEDKTFQYTATIRNTGSSSFSVSKFELRNYGGSTIGDSSASATLSSSSTRSFTLTGNIPAPSNGYLTYYICLYMSEQRTNWWGGTYTYSDWTCSGTQNKQVTSKSNFLCFTDSNCANDKYCYISPSCTSQCLAVSQGSCGHIVDHKWANYECCTDSNCPNDKICSNNFCINVPCTCGYISNHQCIKYECCADTECNYGYFCSDHNCIKYECMENKDCGYDKRCTNHKCLNLNCGYCEHIIDHNCIKYACCQDSECVNDEKCYQNICEKINCKYGEYISNHQCLKHECMNNNDCASNKACKTNKCEVLNCGQNEIIKTHQCVYLSSTPFGYIKNNVYIPYYSHEAFQEYKPIYLGIGILLVAILLGLMAFFIHKHFKGKKPKYHPIEKTYEAKHIRKEEKKTKEGYFCPKCKRELHVEDEFCIFCGVRLGKLKKTETKKEKEIVKKRPKFCNKCGAKLKGNFCSKCGAKQ